MDVKEFRVSSHCSEGGGCVGVAETSAAVLVTNTTVEGGPVLTVDRHAWTEFLDGVKDGQFDL